MNTIAPTRVAPEQEDIVAELSNSNRVRELANYLGLDAESVAEGLVEAVRRDAAGHRDLLALHPQP